MKVLRTGTERQAGHAKNNIPFTNVMTYQKDHSEMTTHSPKQKKIKTCTKMPHLREILFY